MGIIKWGDKEVTIKKQIEIQHPHTDFLNLVCYDVLNTV